MAKTYVITHGDFTEVIKEVKELMQKEVRHFALKGDLGAGKTTFVQNLAVSLGITERIQSPTYVIAKLYPFSGNTLIHIDAYRIQSTKELEVLGFKGWVGEKNAYMFIEWPEKCGDLIPEDAVTIEFEHGSKEEERKVILLDRR